MRLLLPLLLIFFMACQPTVVVTPDEIEALRVAAGIAGGMTEMDKTLSITSSEGKKVSYLLKLADNDIAGLCEDPQYVANQTGLLFYNHLPAQKADEATEITVRLNHKGVPTDFEAALEKVRFAQLALPYLAQLDSCLARQQYGLLHQMVDKTNATPAQIDTLVAQLHQIDEHLGVIQTQMRVGFTLVMPTDQPERRLVKFWGLLERAHSRQFRYEVVIDPNNAFEQVFSLQFR